MIFCFQNYPFLLILFRGHLQLLTEGYHFWDSVLIVFYACRQNVILFIVCIVRCKKSKFLSCSNKCRQFSKIYVTQKRSLDYHCFFHFGELSRMKRYSVKKVFLKIFQNSQENNYWPTT